MILNLQSILVLPIHNCFQNYENDVSLDRALNTEFRSNPSNSLFKEIST